MKKSELKEMIKSSFLSEGDKYYEEDDIQSEAEEVDVEDNEDVDIDIEKDVKIDDEEAESDIEVKSEIPGESEDVAAILGLLTKAQEEASNLGDEKLMDQIGNTITYYTRAHVVAEMADDKYDEGLEDIEEMVDDEEVKEELNEELQRFRKLAGLIK
jgi:hypothetical protein|tara:strand:+ start:4506 stop:4976 length:471 start_codon:yes stop_codon:yes gene_type:complete